MLLGNIALIFLLVGLNAFFVAIEFATIVARRSRLELAAAEGQRSARIVQGWLENPAARDRLIAAAQLGITIVSLALGAVGENTFEHILEDRLEGAHLPPVLAALEPLLVYLPLLLSLLIVTALHVVLGEQVPKVVALRMPERLAILGARPMQLFIRIFKGFIDLLDWVTRHILRLAGIAVVGGHSTIYTVEELKHILWESEEGGVIQAPQREMLESIFDLSGLLVRHVMVPRTEMVGVPASATVDEVLAVARSSTFTKFPVFAENLDRIVGIVHLRDVLRLSVGPEAAGRDAGSLARPPIYLPETASVGALLHQFRAERQHIAIVLDEYGGTAGLVTLEDLLEEIIGEVSDPFDPALPEIHVLPDGSAQVDGLALIAEVNERLGLELSDPNYDTIGGFVMGRLGRLPRLHDVVEAGDWRLRVEAMDGHRIDRLSLTRAAG